MAYVKDLWFSTKTGEDGLPVKQKTGRHGTGKRWLAGWKDPDGRERSKSFDKKTDADRHASLMEADKARGTYIDPTAGKILFGDHGRAWLQSHTADPSTRQKYAHDWRKHIEPRFGRVEIRAIRPGTVRQWVKDLGDSLAPSTVGQVLGLFSAMMSAAVDDELIAKNPCDSKTVKAPDVPRKTIVPWSTERVLAIEEALPDRYSVMALLGSGCGMRQGEIFGLAVEDIDFLRRVVHIRRQVKVVESRLIFGLPKNDRERTVPLPDFVSYALAEHLRKFPAKAVTLPWEEVTGKPQTANLLLTSRESKALNRNYINTCVWLPAIIEAGVIPKPKVQNKRDRGNGMHALRHHFASVVLDSGESIKTLAEYLGHADPGFTLRIYCHFMPASEDRTRKALDDAFRKQSHGTVTEQETG